MIRAHIYIRISKSVKNDPLGADVQLAQCEKYIKENNMVMVSVHHDINVSGASMPTKRPAFIEMCQDIVRGDAIVVARRDRLFRGDEMVTALIKREIARKGARIASAANEVPDGSGATAKLIERVMEAVAEFERLLAIERTTAALRAKERRGEAMGGTPPYGYRIYNGMLLKDTKEQKMIEFVKEMDKRGVTYAEMTRILSSYGLFNRKGVKFHSQQVKRILERTTK